MQGATLGNSGSEAALQLQGRIARAFSSNSLVNTMGMTAAIQYILTAAQSLGAQVYYEKFRMTILGLLVCYSAKTSRHIQNGLSYVPKKILTLMLREAKGGFKATVGNRVKLDYHLIIRIVFFVLFCFFQPDSCVPWQAMLKSMSAHIEIEHCGRLRF